MNERASFLYDVSGNSVTVYIRGEIDHHTAVLIRNGIDGMLFEKRPSKMILDLSAVGFMDSSGLGLIMGRLSVMKSLGGEMSLRNPSRETQNILSLAGLEKLLSIECDRREDAQDAPPAGGAKKSYVPPQAHPMAVPCAVSAMGGAGIRGRTKSKKPVEKRQKSPTTSA